jgi:hypothetical protein
LPGVRLGVDVVSINEAADLINIHPASMRRAVREGRVTGQRFGRDWFVDLKSLAKYEPIRKPKRGRP